MVVVRAGSRNLRAAQAAKRVESPQKLRISSDFRTDSLLDSHY
jgi:hypothetical protein